MRLIVRRTTLVLSTALALALGATGAAAHDLDVTPGQIEVAVPAPGGTDLWEASATNAGTDAVSLYLVVSDVAGAAAGGSHPVRMAVHDGAGVVVVEENALPDLGAEPVLLGTLAPEESLTLHGLVSLPREAGNEYQGAEGALVLDFVTLDGAAPPAGGGLAMTGAGLVWAGVAALLLAVMGAHMITRSRRGRDEREETS